MRFFNVRIRMECSEHVNSFIDAYWAHITGKQPLVVFVWPGFDSCSVQLSDSILVACEKSASGLTLPNIAGFLRLLRFPPQTPVQTLDQWGGGPYWTSRENSLVTIVGLSSIKISKVFVKLKLFCLVQQNTEDMPQQWNEIKTCVL